MRSPHPVACRRRRFHARSHPRWARLLRVDLAHILIPFILHDATNFGEGRQGKVRLVQAPYLGHPFGDANQGIGHAIDVTLTFHRAESGNVLLHQVHLLVNVPQLVIVKVDYISRIGLRPADQHRIGVFE